MMALSNTSGRIEQSGRECSIPCRRGYSYNEVKVYAFLRFTRMVNISNAGIGISE